MKKKAVCLLICLCLLLCGLPVGATETAGPDLVVTDITWQGGGQVAVGTELQFAVTVKNEGTAAVTVPFTVDIGYGTEQLFRLPCERMLAAGESVTLTSPTWSAVAGDRMVTARANSTGTVTEQKETWDNDVRQRNLKVGGTYYEPSFDAIREDVQALGFYDLAFNDDFNDLTGFDKSGKGQEGYKWYINRHSAFPNLKESEYRTQNGILTMDCAIDTFAIGAATIDRITGVGYTFKHGYLEFRLRMPKAGGEDESKTAIWSFPRERYADRMRWTTHVEMDWLEYWGNNYYTVTLHEQTQEGSELSWYSSKNGHFKGLGDEEWHTMGYLWVEGRLCCYLDGELFYTQTWGPHEMPTPIHDVKSGELKFEGVFSYADTQELMLFIFGSSKIPLELDYVRIWQRGDAPAEPATTTQKSVATKKPTAVQKPAGVTAQTEPSATVITAAPTVSEPTAPSATVPTSPAKPFPWGMVLAVALPVAGGVALLGGAVVLVVCLRRKT